VRAAALAGLSAAGLFAPDIARSRRGEPPAAPLQRFGSVAADRLTFYL
jgi:hypothetical protein